jgi:hypothetical protein
MSLPYYVDRPRCSIDTPVPQPSHPDLVSFVWHAESKGVVKEEGGECGGDLSLVVKL